MSQNVKTVGNHLEIFGLPDYLKCQYFDFIWFFIQYFLYKIKFYTNEFKQVCLLDTATK